MKPVPVLVLLALLGGAFFAGRMTAPEGTRAGDAPSTEVAAGNGAADGGTVTGDTLEGSSDASRDDSDPELHGRPESPTPAEAQPQPSEAPVSSGPPMSAPVPVPDHVGTFDLTKVTSGKEALALFQGYARAMWQNGEEGHLDLVRAIDTLRENRNLLRSLGRREEDMVPHFYPLIRFLVANERNVAATGTTVFKTMAENPMAFEGMDDDTLEVFTEGLGPLMPALLPEKEMAQLSAYVTKILETPEEQQSEAVRRNRRRLDRLLVAWRPPLTPAKAAEAIRALGLNPKKAPLLAPLFANLNASQVAEFDLHDALCVLLETGDRHAIELIPGNLAPAERAAYDDAMASALKGGQLQIWSLRNYLNATARSTWTEARPFIEGLLQQGVKPNVLLPGLRHLHVRVQLRPDPTWIRWALDQYPVRDGLRKQLEAQYPEK